MRRHTWAGTLLLAVLVGLPAWSRDQPRGAGPASGAAAPPDDAFVVTSGTGDVLLVDAASRAVLAHWAWGPAVAPPALGADPALLAWAGPGGVLTLLDIGQRRVRATTAWGGEGGEAGEIRALALGGTPPVLLVLHGPPWTLTLLDGNLVAVARHPAATLDGRQRSRFGDLRHNPARRSFVLALPDIAELWEVSHDPAAEPIFDGLVHDHRLGEAISRPGTYGVRRTRLARAIERFGLGPGGDYVIDPDSGQVVHLDIRRAVRAPR